MCLDGNILTSKIKDLKLDIKGTELEKSLEQLYKELEDVRLPFKPHYYFTDDWGCPNNVPIIGIPFYLGNKELTFAHSIIEEVSVIKILRHEVGHCINYAYKLHEQLEWKELFGDYNLPYEEFYAFDPLSDNFVTHLPNSYAQKHPDEDFAETWAVWLDPASNWKQVYLTKPTILNKLKYIDQLQSSHFLTKPEPITNYSDQDSSFLNQTVEEFLTNWTNNKWKDTPNQSLEILKGSSIR